MDIKVGTQTWGPDASEAKQKNEATKYSGTKGPFGFRLESGVYYGPSMRSQAKICIKYRKH